MEAPNSPQRRLQTFVMLFFLFLISVSFSSIKNEPRGPGPHREENPNVGRKRLFEDLEIEYDQENGSLVIHFFTPPDKFTADQLNSREQQSGKGVTNGRRVKVLPLRKVTPGPIAGDGSMGAKEMKGEYSKTSHTSTGTLDRPEGRNKKESTGGYKNNQGPTTTVGEAVRNRGSVTNHQKSFE